MCWICTIAAEEIDDIVRIEIVDESWIDGGNWIYVAGSVIKWSGVTVVGISSDIISGVINWSCCCAKVKTILRSWMRKKSKKEIFVLLVPIFL